MDKMGLKDGEVIQHKMISNSIERAQKKVEENNFAIRKRLLEYDNVMNQQREVIYAKRKQALEGERLKGEVMDYLDEYIDDLLNNHYENAEVDAIHDALLKNLLVDYKISTENYEAKGRDGLKAEIMNAAKEFYSRKEEMLGHELMARLERYAVLSVIDDKWKEHLREMDDLKEGIGLRAYGQKDPLIEYKAEGFKLFVQLLESLRNDTIAFCFKFFPAQPEEIQQRKQKSPQRISTIKDSVTNMGMQGGQTDEGGRRGKAQPVVRQEEKVGRNDPCPCGSGKKYKHCHGRT
jgi:preprotein translocase subunit SecA